MCRVAGSLAIIVVMLAAAPASAQTSSEGWQFAVGPYLWASGMDGTLSIGNQEQEVDASFSDIIDNLTKGARLIHLYLLACMQELRHKISA